MLTATTNLAAAKQSTEYWVSRVKTTSNRTMFEQFNLKYVRLDFCFNLASACFLQLQSAGNGF